MLGDKEVKPTLSELKNKVMFRRKLVALKIIEKGEKFSKDSIGMRRTENDSIFLESDKVIGHEASRRINRGEIIDEKLRLQYFKQLTQFLLELSLLTAGLPRSANELSRLPCVQPPRYHRWPNAAR